MPLDLADEWDYVIVGAGTAAAGLARVLSDNFCRTVLVLEWGINEDVTPQPYDTTRDRDALQRYSELNPSAPIVITNPVPPPNTLNLGSVTMSTARLVGGRSGTNEAQWVRGSKAEWDDFANSLQQQEWNYTAMLPSFRALETFTAINPFPDQHGTTGPVNVIRGSGSGGISNFSNNYISGAVTFFPPPLAAIPLDYNDGLATDFVSSLEQYNVTQDPNNPSIFLRETLTSRLWAGIVDPASGQSVAPRQLRVVTGAKVQRILFDYPHGAASPDLLNYTPDPYCQTGIGPDCLCQSCCQSKFSCVQNNPNAVIPRPRASGVSFLWRGAVFSVRARKRVILCAGVLSSVLLELSGIGEAARLSALGITPVINNDQVGRNLFVPYGVQLVYNTSVADLAPPLDPDSSLGIILSADSTKGAVVQGVTPRQIEVRAQSGIQTAVTPPPYSGEEPGDPKITFSVVNLDPLARGSLHIVTADTTVDPQVEFSFYATSADRLSITNAITQLRNLLDDLNTNFGYGLVPYYPGTLILDDPAFLDDFIVRNIYTLNGFAGTARAALLPSGGVVDSLLRVFGVDNLSVCDASVLSRAFSYDLTNVTAALGVRYGQLLHWLDDCCHAPVAPVINTSCPNPCPPPLASPVFELSLECPKSDKEKKHDAQRCEKKQPVQCQSSEMAYGGCALNGRQPILDAQDLDPFKDRCGNQARNQWSGVY